MTIEQMNGCDIVRISNSKYADVIFTIHSDGLRVWEQTGDLNDFRVKQLFTYPNEFKKDIQSILNFVKSFINLNKVL
jgi:hypothetical protein